MRVFQCILITCSSMSLCTLFPSHYYLVTLRTCTLVLCIEFSKCGSRRVGGASAKGGGAQWFVCLIAQLYFSAKITWEFSELYYTTIKKTQQILLDLLCVQHSRRLQCDFRFDLLIGLVLVLSIFRSVFTARCKARYCDRMSSVCLSVCLSVTLVDCDHIGWT